MPKVDYMAIFDQAIQEAKKQIFVEGYEANDAETIGVMVSKQVKWDGEKIYKAAYAAFEDGNFHTFNEKFEKLWTGEN